MKLKIADLFTSIIGEGVWAGCPASFIRLAGCNLNCKFCDTNYLANEELTPTELVDFAISQHQPIVVITGGEPFFQNITQLVEDLLKSGFKVHIETNGEISIPTNFFQRCNIAVSPKTLNCNLRNLHFADEVKFLCGTPHWRNLITRLSPKVTSKDKWLTPLTGTGVDFTEKAITFCKQHPEFRLCCQIHKYLKIK